MRDSVNQPAVIDILNDLLDVELNKYTTDPYVSLATGNLCRTISTCFRDARNNKMYILCIDVLCE